MRLTDTAIEPARVRAWGARDALEVTAVAPGVLRVRHAPASADVGYAHPALAPKRSPALASPDAPALPLDARRDGDVLTVRAEGASLALALADATWTFRDAPSGRALARSVRASTEVTRAFPVDRYRSRLALDAPAGEAYLGFGEKVGPLDKRGMRFVFWNTDAFPPNPDTDPLYVSVPFALALRDGVAWGLLLDESWRAEVDVALADPARVEWESAGPELDAYLVAGPTPAEVLARYTALTGRPPLPPLWALGAHQSRWGYESADDVRAVVDGYRSRGLPLDVVHLDIDHMDGYRAFTWDRSRFPDPRALARELAERGVRLVTIVDPGLKAEPGYAPYDEAVARGYLVRLDRGDPLVGEVWPDPAVFPDLTRDEVQAWWSTLHRPLLDAGVAGVWNDMNEPACFSVREARGLPAPEGKRAPGASAPEGSTLPGEARHGTKRHLEAHNAYAIGMARAAHGALARASASASGAGGAAARRPFVLTRAGSPGIQRYAAVWTGDFASAFSHLEASIPMLLGMGLSGLAFVGADVPGFLGRAGPELAARWSALGAFYPFLRSHAARGSAPKEPWRFGDAALAVARAALLRRYRLLPTLYTLFWEASNSGAPVMRPLAFRHPADRDALAAFDQFTLGDALLVAPVVRPHQTRRLAYLPAGAWLAWPNLERPGAVTASSAGAHLVVDAPLDVTPAWLRAGAAVALTDAAPHTTTANWGALSWHVHAADEVHAVLYEDAGDGDGPARVTTVRGGRDGARVWLSRAARGDLPLARSRETLVVYGVSGVRAVTGARAFRAVDGGVEIEVDAAWDRVELAG